MGLLLISKIKENFPDINFALYRDDGLGVYKAIPKPEATRTKKRIEKTLKDMGLKIKVEMNLVLVNFLDVTLDLHKNTFEPFCKPNNTPRYIHTESNHPPHIIKQMPTAINKRLCEISCNEEKFNLAKPQYEKALSESGHPSKLKFKEKEANQNKNKKNRSRNIIWYNPPYSAALKTNFGKKFLELIDQNFPKSHNLYRVINRKTVKLSYSCTRNMKNVIQGHNNKILYPKQQTPTRPCNCRDKSTCPMKNSENKDSCCTPCVVYKASVAGQNVHYVGSTEGEFKTRYNGHKQSFKQECKKSSTMLAQYIWEKQLNPNPSIDWSVIKKCTPYVPGQKTCDLCITEKMEIMKNRHDPKFINKSSEMASKCPHQRKFRMCSV